MPSAGLLTGNSYTREEVADAISFPVSKRDGGDYTTGYFEWAGSFYVFANVGVAGRTGHDYPNRWDGKNLVWFSKGNTRLGAPQIERMIDANAQVQIFWRAKDRAPFTYAGQARAIEAVDQQPVKVIWSFEPEMEIETLHRTPEPVFRRGPPPLAGERTHTFEAGDTFLYSMRIDGHQHVLFPDLPSGKVVMKIGISNSPTRRVRELNVGFPPGSSLRWLLHGTRSFPSGDEAFRAEGRILEQMRLGKKWIGGEFVVVDEDECSSILAMA